MLFVVLVRIWYDMPCLGDFGTYRDSTKLKFRTKRDIIGVSLNINILDIGGRANPS